MMQIVTHAIVEALRAVGVVDSFELSAPPKPEMGDVAFPCFGLAKEMKKNPNEVAKTIAEAIKRQGDKEIIEQVEAFGPYVNFFLSTAAIARIVIDQMRQLGAQYGSSEYGKGKSVLIEYPSNNTHKEFHIGHFRNVCIGNTLVQLYRAAGYTVHPVNYLNDFGAHVAKCLWGLQQLHAKEKPPVNKQRWLGEIYAEANQAVESHPAAAAEIAGLQKKLEAHDETVWPLYMETRQWSIEQFERLFKELGVEHESTFYEKDIKQSGHDIVDELLEKNIAEVGEGGAIIIDLKKYHLDVALVRKSNGVGLYLTSDLPLAEEKFKQFDADESIIITGQEQVFYFKQLYKILELLGFKKKLTHINYGLVTRPEGKMSSRLGNVILYEDLRDEVFDTMYKETRSRHAEWPEERVIDTSTKLALAALKFDMQKHEAVKNIVFNIAEATSFEGFSGLYVLYVIARINSLLRKSKVNSQKSAINFEFITTPEEKKLVLLLSDYSDVLQKALEYYNPSTIARYCFDLAQAFNDFYNKQSIVNAETTELVTARLALSNAVKQVLTNALGVLTIAPVEEM